MIRLQQRAAPPTAFALLLPALVLGVTLVLTSGVVLAAGANPLAAVYQFLLRPFTARGSAIEILVSATPLLFTGASVAVAFRAGYWNIGAEGQLLAGAIAAAGIGQVAGGLPAPVAVLAMVGGGVAAGALWALPPAWLRVRFGIDEVVTTLLLNPVALFLVSGLLNGPWRDPVSGFPESPRIVGNAEFPALLPRSRLHLGFVVAVLVIAAGWFVTTRTPAGLKLRAVGLSPRGARFSGIDVERTLFTAALVSGAIAGLAGVSEVAGIQFRLTEGLSPGYGYTGIVVATLGALSMIGALVAGLLLGLINVGAGTAARVLDVPTQTGQVVQAILLLVAVSLLLLRRYRVVWMGRR